VTTRGAWSASFAGRRPSNMSGGSTVRDGDGAGRCTVEWSVEFDPTGTEQEAVDAIGAVYSMMAGWLADAAKTM
jgi:hypothetical protein